MAERLCGHPHIVNLVDAVLCPIGLEPTCLLIYDFAGESVHEYLKKAVQHGPSDGFVRLCVQHLASGLAYLDENGFVHGDLHTKNVLVSNPDTPQANFVVADVGGAFEAGPSWHIGVMEYNAPERLLKNVRVGPRADVFSLGLVFATVVGLTFHFANAKTREQQLRALALQLVFPPWGKHQRIGRIAVSQLRGPDHLTRVFFFDLALLGKI